MLTGLESAGMTLNNKMRLIAIFIISQEGVTEEVRRQLVAAAGKAFPRAISVVPNSKTSF